VICFSLSVRLTRHWSQHPLPCRFSIVQFECSYFWILRRLLLTSSVRLISVRHLFPYPPGKPRAQRPSPDTALPRSNCRSQSRQPRGAETLFAFRSSIDEGHPNQLMKVIRSRAESHTTWFHVHTFGLIGQLGCSRSYLISSVSRRRLHHAPCAARYTQISLGDCGAKTSHRPHIVVHRGQFSHALDSGRCSDTIGSLGLLTIR